MSKAVKVHRCLLKDGQDIFLNYSLYSTQCPLKTFGGGKKQKKGSSHQVEIRFPPGITEMTSLSVIFVEFGQGRVYFTEGRTLSLLLSLSSLLCNIKILNKKVLVSPIEFGENVRKWNLGSVVGSRIVQGRHFSFFKGEPWHNLKR